MVQPGRTLVLESDNLPRLSTLELDSSMAAFLKELLGVLYAGKQQLFASPDS